MNPPLSLGQPCSGAFVDNETPQGAINGTNILFSLNATPNPASSLIIQRNGLTLSSGIDYTLNGSTITFVAGAQPSQGDVLRASYRTGCIGAPAHPLLGNLHSDTTEESVSRGTIITGQGSNPTRWSALPLGASGRCLVSNGTDAEWGECLFTGFADRSLPFVNSTGSLSEDNTGLNFNSSNKRLGVGTGSPASTVHVFDSRASVGTTGLFIQAGAAQGANALTRWLGSNGTELGRVEANGSIFAPRLNVVSNSTRSGYRDSGTTSDPSTRLNGDIWFNTTQQTRKSVEAGQSHPLPQVVCSSSGGSTSSTSLTNLGSCTVPAFYLDSGDRLVVIFTATHTGTSSDFELELRMAGSTLYTRSLPNTESGMAFEGSAGLYGSGAAWQFKTHGNVAAIESKLVDFAINPTSTFTIQFRGRLLSSSADTIAIRNYTVLRYPAQLNP
jgi:hypothetical protein